MNCRLAEITNRCLREFAIFAFLWSSIIVNAQDGFGNCAFQASASAPAIVRNDPRLGQWANLQRGGHSWDFSASSIASGGGGGALLTWWTHDKHGVPTWLMASAPTPALGDTQWSTDLLRVTKVGLNPASIYVVGTVLLRFNVGGEENKLEVDWNLYGTASVAGQPNRQTITDLPIDTLRTECLTEFEAIVSPDLGAPPPSAAFAGAWSMNTSTNPEYANHGFFTYFGRITRDWNSDGRWDEDREFEFSVATFFGETSGNPRWGFVQREVDAIRPQIDARNFTLMQVTAGYAPWGPVGPATAPTPLGVLTHQFLPISNIGGSFISNAEIYARPTHQIGAGKPGTETIRYSPGASPSNPASMNRLTASQFDIAQPADAPFPNSPSTPAAESVSDQVGTMVGSFRVDESGAATYNIPIMTVPAAGGFSPQLSFSYSSNAGEGHLGVGWGISGLSQISRCRKTKESGDAPSAGSDAYPTITLMDASDVYCLDGQRLIQVHSGSESVDAQAHNFFEYRTEIESFSRIRGYRLSSQVTATTTDPQWFAVWSKDGAYREYGRDANAENSRLSANSNGVQRIGITYSWAINKFRDAGKNYFRYVYGVNQNNGEQWINEVRYTGNENTGLTPEAANHRLVFDYQVSSALQDLAYTAGSKMQRTRHITSVRSLSGVNEIRRYTPTYASIDENSNFRRQINQIQECRVDGTTTCYPATQFAVSSGRAKFGSQYLADTPLLANLIDLKYGDVNGDGRADMVWLKDVGQNFEELHLRLTAATGTGIAFNNSFARSFHENFDDDRGWHLLDYNADGKDDLLITEYLNGTSGASAWRVYLSTGSGFDFNPISTGISASNDAEGILADMNGDGLPDLVSGAPNDSIKINYLIKNPANVGGTPYIFSASTPVTFVNPAGGSGLTVRPRRIDHDQFEVFDANGDGRADLVMKGAFATSAAGFPSDLDPDPVVNPARRPDPPQPPTLVAGQDDYWMIFTNQGVTAGSLAFRLLKSWKITLPGAIASQYDTHFRVTDINGDGLADVFFLLPASPRYWMYELNLGVPDSAPATEPRFGPTTCVLSGSTNFVCSSLLPQSDTVTKIQDYDGDGKADLWDLGPQISGDSHQYVVHRWTGNGFAMTPIITGAVVNNSGSAPHVSTFPDLDGDGMQDQLSIRWASGNGNWYYHRSLTPYRPKNMITEITNGYGAKTIIDYAPMTFSSVYRRDYHGPFTKAGRGSSIQDVVGSTYLVAGVSACAPTETQSTCVGTFDSVRTGFNRVEYAYQGAKMQAGGRGSLGFRVLETYDVQRFILTRTEYEQKFPLIGRTKYTSSWYLPTLVHTDACSNVYGVTCFQPAPIFLGDRDLPEPLEFAFAGVFFSESEVSPYANKSQLSNSSDYYKVRYLITAPNGDNSGQWLEASLPPYPNQPATFRIDQIESSKSSYDMNAMALFPNALQTLRRERTLFEVASNGQRFDDYGNALKTIAETYNGADQLVNSVVGTLTYTNQPVTWQLGRLTQTNIVTTRNGISNTRTSSFDYDPITKLLTRETVMPGGGALNELNTFYQYDSFGNKIKTATCSADFNTAATCLNVSAASIASQPVSDQQIRRYARSVFDAQGRYANSAIDLFYLSDTAAREVTTSTASLRNIYGDPQTITTATGITSNLAYGALGRKYFEKNNIGVSATTRYRLCTSVSCPAGGKFRVETVSPGSASTWVYFDMLGRDILAVKEAFAANQFIAVRKHYDHLSRIKKVSEPYFAIGPNASGVEASINGTIYWTTNTYDVLDRPTQVQHPNNTSSTFSYSGLQTIATNSLGQARTEIKNSLGEVIRVTDAASNSICYSYDTFGNLASTGKSNNSCSVVTNTQTMIYDDLGRKTSMIDADMGTWTYQYNAAGEMFSQISPRGVCTKNQYDVRGRVYRRVDYANAKCTIAEHISTWLFDSLSPGQLTSESSDANYSGVAASSQIKNISYDLSGRVSQVITNVDGQFFIERSTYDQFGRAFQNFDASGSGVLTQYNPRGYLYRIRDAVPGVYGEVYYEVREMDARDKITKEWRGVNVQTVNGVPDQAVKGLETRRNYNAPMGWLTGIQSGESQIGNAYIQNWTYSHDNIGNVTIRQDWRADGLFQETANYDALNRLSTIWRYQGTSQTLRATENYSYDAWGNMLTKPGITGNINYAQTNGACSLRPTAGPHAASSANGINYCYDQAGNQVSGSDGRNITYTVADQVRAIAFTATNKSTRYYYDAGRSRYKRLDYATSNFTGAAKTTVHVGSVEYITTADNITEVKRYIAGVAIFTNRSNGNDKREFLFADQLGSADVITDRFGNVDNLCFTDSLGTRCRNGQRMSFDAFGLRRQVADNTTLGWTQLSLGIRANFDVSKTTHGYTGHEMVDGVDLVHMNGRMYDPELGRFIQADPFIQDPYNTQSLNRYSYVMNNPWTATDPNGYFSFSDALRMVAAVVITVYSGGTAAGAAWGFYGAGVTAAQAWAAVTIGGALSGAIQSGTLKGAVIGAFSGAVFHGIGVSNLGTTDRILAHAVAGGALSELQGGKFGHGFVTAGFSKAITPLIDTGNVFADGALHAVVGGTTSTLGGGKFANGALTSTMQFAFNQVASRRLNKGQNHLILVGHTGRRGSQGANFQRGADTLADSLRSKGGDVTVVTVHNETEFANALIENGQLNSVHYFGHSDPTQLYLHPDRGEQYNLDYNEVHSLNYSQLRPSAYIMLWGCAAAVQPPFSFANSPTIYNTNIAQQFHIASGRVTGGWSSYSHAQNSSAYNKIGSAPSDAGPIYWRPDNQQSPTIYGGRK